jgi:hypothetical protein
VEVIAMPNNSRRRRDDFDDYDDRPEPRRRSAVGAGFGGAFGAYFGCLAAVAVAFAGGLAIIFGCCAGGVHLADQAKKDVEQRKAEIVVQQEANKQAAERAKLDQEAKLADAKKAREAEQKRLAGPIVIGEVVAVKGEGGTALVATTIEFLNKLTEATRKKDEIELGRLSETRMVGRVPNGDTAKVAKIEGDYVRIEFVKGIFAGDTYYISSANLAHIPNEAALKVDAK